MNSVQDAAHWLQTLDFSNWSPEENELADWLDLRDASPFDAQWMRSFALVLDHERDHVPTPDELKALEQLRKTAFSKAAKATGSTELAAYISDDLDLLARAARVELEDDWLVSLHRAYEEGRFPTGVL